jgi:acetyl esterase/lipase
MIFVLALLLNIRQFHDVSYGADARQRFDVYASAGAHNAPVIVMVHGGGWRIGDKSNARMYENKANYWVPKGYVFVSVNYRMLPDADPLEQARDVAHAIAAIEEKAATWGGDRSRVIVMGHSAGAHLIALITTSQQLAPELRGATWKGAVLLDSGALDVPAIMHRPHFRLYDDAFGSDPAFWRSVSPYHALTKREPPVLAVC